MDNVNKRKYVNGSINVKTGSGTTPSFAEFLDHLSDPNSRYHNRAWQEFMSRYKELIYYNVAKRSREWQVPRLKLQFNDTVDDIVAEVLTILCEKEFQALRNFRKRDDEKAFRWYLITTCHHAAGRYIRQHLLCIADLDPAEMHDLFTSTDIDVRGHLYEFIVDALRDAASASRKNLERDIHIYLSYVWADFDQAMLAVHPCLGDLRNKPRIVDNVVHRLRNILRRKKNG